MVLVTVSSKGQVVIPREIRQRLGLREGSKVAVEATGDAVILLRPARHLPRGWKGWRGAFADRNLLQGLAAEHAAEIARDAARRR